jgi:hypothetical protein
LILTEDTQRDRSSISGYDHPNELLINGGQFLDTSLLLCEIHAQRLTEAGPDRLSFI